MITVSDAKRRLAVVWFIGGGVLFLVLVLGSILDKYGTKVEDMWQWFLPTLLPTLSLMIAVFVVEALEPTTTKIVETFFYRLALCFSIAYLLIVAMTLGGIAWPAEPNWVLLTRSNLWLAPLQGLTSGLLGIFFIKKQPTAG